MYVQKHGADYAMLWINVDDGVLVTRNDTIMERLKLKLKKRLRLVWDEDINSRVGIEINREGNCFILKQPRLIKKLIQVTERQPLPEIQLESSPESQIEHKYLLEIGMILYLAQAMPPDIMYAVNYLSRFAMNTQQNHWKALNHLVDYINTTKHQNLKRGVEKRKEEYGGLC
ncbi:hypothetical protein O181_015284 [Austropuccinia psidii MF-1]|uniref:Reverse transcriptase Ty1/copia-type domain-containing protein n=1 Tax=Austropuccinia psidii MF-1 TaxID=1389203 RepID=A0A9Q3GQP1_9BASI|nr:hypothetical protein [Austropuccinia psidii MF-1]